MIRQQFDVDGYWRVIVYYNLNYGLFGVVEKDLREAGISSKTIETLYGRMKSGRAKAVTCSNIYNKVSIVLFNKHKDRVDYINSLVHEAEHIKQAMLKSYRVKDEGEEPAYTIGYLVSRMWEVFGEGICI